MQSEGKAAKRLKVTTFSVGSVLLNELMVAVMEFVQPRKILKDKLYQVNFHTTLSGEGMVTLIYHKKLGEEWIAAATEMRSVLKSVPSCTSGVVQVIGRSRKQKVDLAHNYVDEVMTVLGKDYAYRQVEGAFSQPNGGQLLSYISVLLVPAFTVCSGWPVCGRNVVLQSCPLHICIVPEHCTARHC